MTEVVQVTSGGAHAVAVFTAVKAGFDVAPRMLRTGGKLIVIGCPSEEVSFNATELALGRYSILGASNHAKMSRLTECVNFTLEHGIEAPIRSFKIEQVEEMVRIMESGELNGHRLVVGF